MHTSFLHFFQTTTEKINRHYETCTNLAHELSNLWTTYSGLLAEEHLILQEQVDTSILNSSEDIEHNEVTLTSFKLLVANSTTISSSTTIIAEVEPEMDHTLLKQCLEIKAKIMVITYFIFIIYNFHIFYNFHILGED